jgi:hypothetical protein
MELNAVEKYRSSRKKQAGASLAACSNHAKTAGVVPAGAGNAPVPLVYRDADDVPTDNTTQQKSARSTYSLSRSGNTTTLRE